jgi:alpha-methylacyl-CoA racemase
MGPLTGIRIVEFAGIGPGPFAAMMLADMGAVVLRIDRRSGGNDLPVKGAPDKEITLRGRKSITLDLKDPRAVETALRLGKEADAVIEGFRPGVMERLGLGPDEFHAQNPALVYGRMTGWGQDGPLSHAAGHDINYIALSGALAAIGGPEAPVPPLNLVGDFAGGGMFLAYGIVCALLRAKLSGKGDVVDAAICDGTAALMAPVYGYRAKGSWEMGRAANHLDGGAPYYGVYQCSDGKWISIAPLEGKFWKQFLELLDLPAEDFGSRFDKSEWPGHKVRFAGIFATRSRAEWCALLEGTDVCFAPVLDMEEAPAHAHNVARGILVERDGVVQPAPAPRFRDAPTELPGPPPQPGADNATALQDWGFSDKEAAELAAEGVL